MMRFNFSRFLSAIFSILLLGCTGPSDPPILSITGVWHIQNIQSNISEIAADPKVVNENIGDQGLFIQFYSNLDFATNTDISLTKLLVSDSPLRTGKYSYVVENGVNRIVLQFIDPEFNAEVALNFTISNMDTNNPVLRMNKQDYISSLQESAANLSEENKIALNTFANRIIDANFTLNCEKK